MSDKEGCILGEHKSKAYKEFIAECFIKAYNKRHKKK